MINSYHSSLQTKKTYTLNAIFRPYTGGATNTALCYFPLVYVLADEKNVYSQCYFPSLHRWSHQHRSVLFSVSEGRKYGAHEDK